ncbi:RyR domain-containing protein [Prevotella sp. E13-27]|uniref:RyR domain-containing protein n=1 Tax=Prevotella sp. E13-27 TaxID=2938122 RepID=UPI00200A8C50|nr:RyR domain-containing protein [Prevotella sp. E13-27]MCK8621056.1 RyR domain-containing protein [Prevotella sp. E13-27]
MKAQHMEITNELLAAYASGNVSDIERNAVRQYLMEHPDELETVMMLMDDDFDVQLDSHQADSAEMFNHGLDSLLEEVESTDTVSETPSVSILPIMSRAAKNVVDNLCAVKCEGYALRTLGIDVSDQELEKEAEENGWLKEEGTALYSIGQLSAKRGLFVSRKYDCTINDIKKSLKHGDIVIAVIDNSELFIRPEKAKRIDDTFGQLPNHAIIIKSIDEENQRAELLNPSDSNDVHSYPLDVFLEAWNDSSNYLVISNRNHYKPHPINLSEVSLTDDILVLQEVFAENVHEVWAKARIDDGWKYGPLRDDVQKTDPSLLPYDLLLEREKEYCRLLAIDTIKCLKKLGWRLAKNK